jgi:hypothetical protein
VTKKLHKLKFIRIRNTSAVMDTIKGNDNTQDGRKYLECIMTLIQTIKLFNSKYKDVLPNLKEEK